jgi:hypothetical protein
MKYSPASSEIEVIVRREGNEANVLVLDRGIGLGDTDPERLFTAFFRTEEANRYTSGIGVGLAVAGECSMSRAAESGPARATQAALNSALPCRWPTRPKHPPTCSDPTDQPTRGARGSSRSPVGVSRSIRRISRRPGILGRCPNTPASGPPVGVP